MHTEWRSIQTLEGPMRAWCATPGGGGPFAAVVVLQEAFGVTEHIRDVTEKLAAAGYVAVAPDLFHRFDQSALSETNFDAARALMAKLTRAQSLADIAATVTHLHARPEVRHGAIGVVGFCMGGRLAFLAAAQDKRIAAAVSYYAGGMVTDAPDAPVRSAKDVAVPLLMFFGGADPHIPAEHVRAVDEALSAAGKSHEVVTYPTAGHAFLRDRPAGYFHPDAARDAWKRTLTFLATTL